jgi:hypothetical protein
MQFIKCYLVVRPVYRAYFSSERLHRACPSGGG